MNNEVKSKHGLQYYPRRTRELLEKRIKFWILNILGIQNHIYMYSTVGSELNQRPRGANCLIRKAEVQNFMRRSHWPIGHDTRVQRLLVFKFYVKSHSVRSLWLLPRYFEQCW
jgi:hypothetical protein